MLTVCLYGCGRSVQGTDIGISSRPGFVLRQRQKKIDELRRELAALEEEWKEKEEEIARVEKEFDT